MIMDSQRQAGLPHVRVRVMERGGRCPSGSIRCAIGEDIQFDVEHLASYCLAPWEPVVFDALLVAGAVEYCDRILKRPALGWGRRFEIGIPVHEPDRWNDRSVAGPLIDALDFLTGDSWDFRFTGRQQQEQQPPQGRFNVPVGATAVIPYSDGLDSRAVAALMKRELGIRLVRVRLGSKSLGRPAPGEARDPFTAVPYKVRASNRRLVETTSRSRGFKFAMVSGLAAYLVKAAEIIVPESGQGALGPALVPVGHGYEDYRNHPLFTDRMEDVLHALFHHRIRFRFPRLWYTKGETLAAFAADPANPSCLDAWSCWQQSRQVSVNGRKRQCGVCAACLLRRLSMHAAQLAEKPETYVWENLGAKTFEDGAATGFAKVKITTAMREYAIAGTLHHDHLAALAQDSAQEQSVKRSSLLLGVSQELSPTDTETRLRRLLAQHGAEWKAFVGSLGGESFLQDWAHAA